VKDALVALLATKASFTAFGCGIVGSCTSLS